MSDGGAKESDLEWMSVPDKHDITRGGFVPTQNDIAGPVSDSIIKLTPEQAGRLIEAGMPDDITEFLEAEGIRPKRA